MQTAINRLDAQDEKLDIIGNTIADMFATFDEIAKAHNRLANRVIELEKVINRITTEYPIMVEYGTSGGFVLGPTGPAYAWPTEETP